jgi:hypothetical protein
MLLVAAATAIVVVETLSIGVASAQQASPASPTPSCSNTPPAQTVEHTQPSAKECGQAAISISSISLDFGSVKVGTDSNPQYATLTNIDDVPVNILVSYSEDNPPYTVTGDNCQNLQPQQSCQIKAIFHPRKTDPTTVIVTLIGHPVNGSLPDSKPQIVSLTGVGV